MLKKSNYFNVKDNQLIILDIELFNFLEHNGIVIFINNPRIQILDFHFTSIVIDVNKIELDEIFIYSNRLNIVRFTNSVPNKSVTVINYCKSITKMIMNRQLSAIKFNSKNNFFNNLSFLDIANNNIKSLEFILELKNLELLLAHNNLIEKVPLEIIKLLKLKFLDLRYNKVTDVIKLKNDQYLLSNDILKFIKRVFIKIKETDNNNKETFIPLIKKYYKNFCLFQNNENINTINLQNIKFIKKDHIKNMLNFLVINEEFIFYFYLFKFTKNFIFFIIINIVNYLSIDTNFNKEYKIKYLRIFQKILKINKNNEPKLVNLVNNNLKLFLKNHTVYTNQTDDNFFMLNYIYNIIGLFKFKELITYLEIFLETISISAQLSMFSYFFYLKIVKIIIKYNANVGYQYYNYDNIIFNLINYIKHIKTYYYYYQKARGENTKNIKLKQKLKQYIKNIIILLIYSKKFNNFEFKKLLLCLNYDNNNDTNILSFSDPNESSKITNNHPLFYKNKYIELIFKKYFSNKNKQSDINNLSSIYFYDSIIHLILFCKQRINKNNIDRYKLFFNNYIIIAKEKNLNCNYLLSFINFYKMKDNLFNYPLSEINSIYCNLCRKIIKESYNYFICIYCFSTYHLDKCANFAKEYNSICIKCIKKIN